MILGSKMRFRAVILQVELVNDSLYEWNVKLHKVDPDSQLAEDLQKLKDKEGTDHILMSFTFKVIGSSSICLFTFHNLVY